MELGLKGKKVMIVNTASKCGNTPQYEQLQLLYKTYGGEEFTIIGFPANNFMGQEPGTNSEIAEFCEKNYISASKIREAIKQDKLKDVLSSLPESTKKFLLSEDSAEIRLKIINSNDRH